MIRDTEYGGVYDIGELLVEYTELKAKGQTEAETFEDYLNNITSKNGTCEWMDKNDETTALQT